MYAKVIGQGVRRVVGFVVGLFVLVDGSFSSKQFFADIMLA